MDLGALTGFLNSLQSYSADLVQHLEADAKLCHYTTLDGALGIIQGGDLWLSHLRFSNDDEELTYGLRLAETELAALRGEAGADALRVARVDAVLALLAAERDQPIYITCFCEQDNLLSQWRGYADNGGGVSIEFDRHGMRRYCGPDSPFGLTRLWRVFYDEAQQRKIVRKAFDYEWWPSMLEADRARSIADALQFFLPTFKNGDFRGEMERRLIHTPGGAGAPQPRFRVRSGLVVPYMRMRQMAGIADDDKAHRLPIVGVRVGPGRHRHLNRDSLRMALNLNGYAHAAVEVSSTPYRG